MSDASAVSPRRILRAEVVDERVPLSRTQRWRLIRDGRFPAPIQLADNSVGWFEDEIEAWIASRPRVSYAPPQPAPDQGPWPRAG